MKLNEFIDSVNTVADVRKNSQLGKIQLYSDKSADSWFFQFDPYSKALDGDHNWKHLGSLDSMDLFYILGLVQELRKTKVKDRGLDKKYRLRWFDRGYVCCIYGHAWYVTPESKNAYKYTQDELDKLASDNPKCKKIIDLMEE